MRLSLSFCDLSRHNNYTLAEANTTQSEIYAFEQIKELPLDKPCNRIEFNLYKDGWQEQQEDTLSSEFARNTLGHTHNASFHHALILEHDENDDKTKPITLKDYVDYFTTRLSEEYGVPKERMIIFAESTRSNGNFKDELTFRDGEFKSRIFLASSSLNSDPTLKP